MKVKKKVSFKFKLICRGTIQGGTKRVSHYQIIKISYKIVLRPVNYNHFIRHITV